MWEVTANGEVDVDDHSKEDLDVSNLFSIVNAFFFFFLRSLFCSCVSCWFPISCLTFYRKMSLHLRSTEGIAQILNMRYWPNVRWLDVGQEFCVLITKTKSWSLNMHKPWPIYSILSEQALSKKELLYGHKNNFLLRGQREKSRAGNTGPSYPLG